MKSLLRLKEAVRKNVVHKQRISDLTHKLEGKYSYGNIIGKSPKMRQLYLTLEILKDSDANILITGETGTGKDLAANAIHYNGRRKGGPMISVNCGAIPRELMERELFGHTKGAFTGAVESRKGYFQEAHGGTLFLDEIGEMDHDMQTKLLRVLEQGEVLRVGETIPRKIDVRIVAATARDLRREVQSGTFREDLFYRIHVIPIHLPPLRERGDDIPLLIAHFLEISARRHNKPGPVLSNADLQLLVAYPFPGNVRELQNLIERYCVLGTPFREMLQEQLQPRDVVLPEFGWTHTAFASDNPIKAAKSCIEKQIIQHALETCGGKITEACEKLHIGRAYLYRKIKEYELQ
ncbi:sigma-54 interaction domain-containing protein [Thermodesulfobacteriota bacterium]